MWGGIGLMLLGMVIGILTFVSVIGPILGLILMAMGIFVMGWGSRLDTPGRSSR